MNHDFHTVFDCDKLFYYFNSENESNSLFLRLELAARVDKFLLKKALNKTLMRYPNFCQTPVLDEEGNLFTVDNSQEAEVFPYDPDPVNLGTKDTNGFLFRVMYEGNTIWISVFHGVCDGGGFMMFVRTLMYYYFTYSGFHIHNDDGRFLTEEIAKDSSEMSDPYKIETSAEPAPNPFKPSGTENMFFIPEKTKESDQCSHHGLYRFILDTDKLITLSKEAGTTVDTYLHLLIARAIHDGYDTQGKLISGIGAVDIRPYYKSRYLQNLTDLFWIYYTDEFFELPERAACGLIKRLFKDQQLSKDSLDRVRLESGRHFHEMFQFPYTNAKGLKMMRDAFWTSPDINVTYFMTNLIRFNFGEEIDPLIAHADIYGPDIFRCPVFFILTQGHETTVNITQRSLNRSFPLKMRKAFEKAGLLTRDELGLAFESDKIRADQIPVAGD